MLNKKNKIDFNKTSSSIFMCLKLYEVQVLINDLNENYFLNSHLIKINPYLNIHFND